MHTKRDLLLLSATTLLALLPAACNDEDPLTAIPDELPTLFAPSADDDSDEARLRRSFYQSEQCYLLFNDTLRHEPLGVDFNGDMRYFTETLDMGYSVGNDLLAQYKTYAYSYLDGFDEKQAATRFLQTSVLPHLPATLRPFSWLMVRSITDRDTGDILTALSGQRAVAVAVGSSVISLSDAELQQLAISVLSTSLSKSILTHEALLQSFYDVCSEQYDQWFDLSEWSSEANMKGLNEAGFITEAVSWGYVMMGKYPGREADVSSYVALVLGSTPDEIAVRYADYPLVQQKAMLLRDIISRTGYIF